MSRIHFLAMSLIPVFICVTAQAQTTTTTVVEKQVVISPAPTAGNCTTVPAHWESNVWVNTQTVCTYEKRTEGVAWVQDYWACTTYTPEGNCLNWEYKPGHWVKTFP